MDFRSNLVDSGGNLQVVYVGGVREIKTTILYPEIDPIWPMHTKIIQNVLGLVQEKDWLLKLYSVSTNRNH